VIGQLVLRGTRIVLPSKLRPQAIPLAHKGHLGIIGTKQNLRRKVWWPGIDKATEKFCKSCYGCQLVARPNPPEPLTSWSSHNHQVRQWTAIHLWRIPGILCAEWNCPSQDNTEMAPGQWAS